MAESEAPKSAFSDAKFSFKPTTNVAGIPAATMPASAQVGQPTKGGCAHGCDHHHGATQPAGAADEEARDPAVQARVDFLQKLGEARSEVIEKYKAERVELENKYQALLRPLYEKRSDVINGRLEVAKSAEGEFAESAAMAEAPAGVPRGIPSFWVTAMANSRELAAAVHEDDVPALEHLTDIKAIDAPAQDGFTLEFHFSDNPYFTNSVLSKTYVIPNMLDNSEPLLKSVTGTAIDWRAGKNLTVETKRMKPKGKKRGPPILKEVPKESFFHFFAQLNVPDMDEPSEEDMEDYEEIMQRLEFDYTLGMTIKDEVVPNAVKFFTGEVEEEEEDDEDDEDEDDDDEDDSEEEGGRAPRRSNRIAAAAEEEDDEDSSDEDEAGAEGPKAGSGKSGQPFPTNLTGPGAGEQQECKQS